MGREIVYCEGCGVSLREADFQKGKACEVENRPYCTPCAPVSASPPPTPVQAPPPPLTPRGAGKKVSTSRIPSQPGPTPRRAMPAAAPPKSNTTVIVGAVVGGIVLLILLVVAATGKPKPPPPKVEAPERPAPKFAEKTAFVPREAGTEPPSRRPSLVQKEPEALKEPTAEEKARKVGQFLETIRSMIAADKAFERRGEIEGMIAAAERSAGDRLPEVQALRALHAKAFEDAAKAACDALRSEAEKLWAEKSYAEAAAKALGVPEAFKASRPGLELRKLGEDYERRAEPAALKDREDALARWKAWKATCGEGMPKYHPVWGGREHVYETHPLEREVPAALERIVDVPAGKKTLLSFWVAPHAQGDWELRVLADGKELHRQSVGPPDSGWKAVKVDLSAWAGKTAALRLENAASGWSWEFAYWADLEIRSE